MAKNYPPRTISHNKMVITLFPKKHLHFAGDIANAEFTPDSSHQIPVPVGKIFCDKAAFWSAQRVKVITECLKNVCQNHQLGHGKISVLGNPNVTDAIWSYIRRPEMTTPEKFYLVKVSFSHHDLRNIILELKRVKRDLEHKRICLYGIDIT